MNRRRFLAAGAALAAVSGSGLARAEFAGAEKAVEQASSAAHGFPKSIVDDDPYIEKEPIAEYHPASAAAYEAFEDMKFGVRIHWGIYSIWHRGAESWPFLGMSLEDRQKYNELYKTWNPAGFDADKWTSIFEESGMKILAFTTRHHEGFSMFDTKTRVKRRVNWLVPGWPAIEDCDLAYSIMETPFKRDVVKELTDDHAAGELAEGVRLRVGAEVRGCRGVIEGSAKLIYHFRMRLFRISVIAFALCAGAVFTLGMLRAEDKPQHGTADKQVRLHLRTEIQPFHESEQVVEAGFDSTIVPSHTAIIITDMWDRHWCHGATERVGQIAERMEPVLEQARKTGILIVHSPSDTMDFYANTPERKTAENAPKLTPPAELAIKDAPLPIDDSNGGCDTGDTDVNKRVWSRQIATLKIQPGDVISDDGNEIYNVLKARGIDTILYMGVHANMCILNRTFGVRQMTKWGLRCIIVRDLMDAMYEPKSRPFVSHQAGTELVYKFIEQYWAPSVTSKDLVSGLSASAKQ